MYRDALFPFSFYGCKTKICYLFNKAKLKGLYKKLNCVVYKLIGLSIVILIVSNWSNSLRGLDDPTSKETSKFDLQFDKAISENLTYDSTTPDTNMSIWYDFQYVKRKQFDTIRPYRGLSNDTVTFLTDVDGNTLHVRY